jgi:hypothetical protein
VAGGEMTTTERLPDLAGRRLVLAVDAMLRRAYGVYEYSRDPMCILRLSPLRSRWDLTLADGTHVRRGDPLMVLHFWNERLPVMRAGGVDLSWAREMHRRVDASLEMLARHFAERPDLARVVALCGEATFMRSASMSTGVSLLSRLGLEVQPALQRTGLWGRFGAFWENVYSWALVWAYNPASLRGRRPSDLERYWLWMSRRRLIENHGGKAG